MWPWAVTLLLLIALAVATFLPVDYYVNGPGSVTATQPRVDISGHRSYESDGEIMYTTVSERHATPLLLLQAWLDSTIDIVPEDVAVPTGNRQEERRYEQQLMDRSKITSIEVAFNKLGLPVTINGTGAFITDISKDFPASAELSQGDVITAVGGTPVKLASDVRPLIEGLQAGDDVDLTVRHRDDQSIEDVTVELGRNEEDLTRGYLGVALETADEDVQFPFEVNLDSGSVIGPSAGLAWTLGVIDRLTPGDLTQGKRVAVTGTIDPDGTVGPIGGISQKVAGAIDEGATLFLYPDRTGEADVKRMTKIANGHITLKPVATLDDALAILDPDGLGASEK